MACTVDANERAVRDRMRHSPLHKVVASRGEPTTLGGGLDKATPPAVSTAVMTAIGIALNGTVAMPLPWQMESSVGRLLNRFDWAKIITDVPRCCTFVSYVEPRYELLSSHLRGALEGSEPLARWVLSLMDYIDHRPCDRETQRFAQHCREYPTAEAALGLQRSLKGVTTRSLHELKNYAHPPASVIQVATAVHHLLVGTPLPPDPWPVAREVFGSADLLRRAFGLTTVPEKQVAAAREAIGGAALFDVTAMRHAITACAPLAEYVNAILRTSPAAAP